MNNVALLLLPLAFLHAQIPAGDSAPFAASRRSPDRSARVAPASSASAAIQSRVLPRILSGGNWRTSVVLLNTGLAAVTFQQFFFAADGKPALYAVHAEPAAEDITTSAIQGVLAPGATLKLTLSAMSAATVEGWSLLTYVDGPGALAGYTLIGHRGSSGGFESEIAAPFSGAQEYSAYIPFDNTAGFRSQLTLVNPAGNLSTQVRLTYLNAQGQALLLDLVTLRPAEQMTLALPDSYPDLANKSGSVLVEADTDRLSITGLRCNEGVGAIAALPVMLRSAASPAQ